MSLMIVGRRLSLSLAVTSALAIVSASAQAQTPEAFYTGRTINVIVPYGPGGYYDIGARLLARHLGKHIVGKPNIIVQNQPSAGGIGLGNKFAMGVDNDGATLGVLQRAVPQYAFVGYQSARFNPLHLTWIGSLSGYANDSYLMTLNASHPVKTIAQLQQPNPAIKTRLGSGRSGSANLLYALMAKDVLKLNFDIVRGYEGTAPIFLAQQRHEVDGLFADLSAIKVANADAWKKKDVIAVVQFGRKTRSPEVPDVPTARELVKDPGDLAFLEFAELPFFIALPIAGPAGMPPDRLKALQDGFMAMAADPAFLEDAAKMHYDVDPISGPAVAAAIAQAAKASPEVMARFKALISQ
jgi:tripartite-type tricarboxylate transporter receptor subunit TctC